MRLAVRGDSGGSLIEARAVRVPGTRRAAWRRMNKANGIVQRKHGEFF
jgi:hypothetical protein